MIKKNLLDSQFITFMKHSKIITDLVYIEKEVVMLYGGPVDEEGSKEVENPVGMISLIKYIIL